MPIIVSFQRNKQRQQRKRCAVSKFTAALSGSPGDSTTFL